MSDFTVLGLPEGASEDDIKYAYKQLAMKHHPDRGGDMDKFIDIKQAYERLIGKKGTVLELIKVKVPCNKCGGSGNRVIRQGLGYFSEVCGRCRGTGKINKKVAK